MSTNIDFKKIHNIINLEYMLYILNSSVIFLTGVG